MSKLIEVYCEKSEHFCDFLRNFLNFARPNGTEEVWMGSQNFWKILSGHAQPETAIGVSWLRFTVQKVNIFVIFYPIFSISPGLMVLERSEWVPKISENFY